MGAVRTDILGHACCSYTRSRMVCSRWLYGHDVSSYSSDCFVTLAALDRQASIIAAGLHSRRLTADDAHCPYYVATSCIAYHHRTSTLTHGGGCRAVPAEDVLHLPFRTNLSDRLTVVDYHGCSRANAPQYRFGTNNASDQSSEGEQLLLLLPTIAMLFSQRKLASSNWSITRMVHFGTSQVHDTKAAMGKAKGFIPDAMGHSFSNLYQPGLHW